MADQKISQLTAGDPSLVTDEIPVSRTADSLTRKVTALSVARLLAGQTVAIGDLPYATATAAAWGRIAAVATGQVLTSAGVNTAPAYSATTGITGVGTIGTGVWQGTAVAGLYGGTGLTTAAVGDIMYASATTPTWARLADVAVGSVLVSTGVASAPAYSATPTITTSLTTPTLYGGAAAGSTLTLAGTSNGTPSSAHIALNVTGQGNVGIGTATPAQQFQVYKSGGVPIISALGEWDVASMNAQVSLESYSGTNVNSGGVFTAYSIRGTVASPTLTKSGDLLFTFGGRGYTDAKTTNDNAAVKGSAGSDWSATNAETKLAFLVTPSGSTTLTTALTVASTGNVGIGTTAPSASTRLDVTSTTGAFLPPRMTSTQRDALTPINGMILYNSTTGALNYYKAGTWTAI